MNQIGEQRSDDSPPVPRRGRKLKSPEAKAATLAAIKSRTEKRCTACKGVKPVDQFYSNPGNRDGYGSVCMDCNTTDRFKMYYRKMIRDKGPAAVMAVVADYQAKVAILLNVVTDYEGKKGEEER